MRKLLFSAWACLAGVAGADVVVDAGATHDVTASSDATQTGNVFFSADAHKLEKDGAGAWTLPASQVMAPGGPAVVGVRAGALNLTAGSPGDLPIPTEALNKAALWFDAAKADSRVEETGPRNTGVATWYDARERQDAAGDWGRRYHCATARTSWLTNEVTGAKEILYPVAKTYADRPGLTYVDFNGRKSGSWMGFLTPARANQSGNIEQVRHVFLAGYVSDAWGFVLGSATSPTWHPSNTEGSLGWIASANSASPALFAGRSTWNGKGFDEAATTVPKGPYVYSWEAGDLTAVLSNFFNDRNLWLPNYFRCGGDSLGEVLVFTNRLTALEREQVSAYMLRKWGGPATAPAFDVRTARGASVAVGTGVKAAVSGSGTLRLETENAAQAYSQTADFAGATRVAASAAKLVAAQPRLALEAGDAYAVMRDNYDVLGFARTTDAAKTAAGEAALNLAASAAVRVDALPESVKKVSVSGAGELVLGAARAPDGIRPVAGEVYATMPNADMEEWTGSASATGFGTAGATSYHWKLVSTTTVNYFLNMPACASVGHWTLDGGNKANFRWSDYPCQGRNVMLLKQGCVVENTVTFPEDGDYELTFLSFGRMDGGLNQYAGGWVKMSLVNGPGADVAIGTAFGYVGTSTQHQRFRVRGVKKGAYTFRLDHAVGTGDAHTALDDFRFRLVTDIPSETVVRPPNADFEQVDMTWGGRLLRNAGNVPAGWTLTSSTADPDVCVITRGMSNAGYRGGSAYGGVQLALYGPGGSATSGEFTLPAGTWKLRLRRANFSNTEGVTYRVNNKAPNTSSGVTAVLLDGEQELSFGTSGSSAGGTMAQVQLPAAVTLAEPRTVRLRLKESVSNASQLPTVIVDDVELVRQGLDGELLRNGTFADESVWVRRTNKNFSTEANSNKTWKSQSNIWDPCRQAAGAYAYGNTYGVNRLALDLCQCGSAEQTVDFPAAGAYRLAFSARSRFWVNANAAPGRTWGGNQARFFLVDAAGATNEIYRTPSLYSTNFVFRNVLFDVPAAGTYTFGIQGVNGMTLPDGTLAKVGYSAEDVELFVDQVSVTPADDAAFGLDEKLVLALADTAKLRLDFAGTNEVQALKLGGRSVAGYVDASHPSGLVLGTGCLFIRPRCTVLILR